MSGIFEQLIAHQIALASHESVDITKVAQPDTIDVTASGQGIAETKVNPDEGDLEIRDNVEAMFDESKKIEEKQKEFEEGMRVRESMESLLQGTLDTYRDTGMSAEALNLYSISVESALRVAGLSMPVEVMVPSFEAGDTQVAVVDKVEKKGNSVLATIKAWMIKAWNWCKEALRKFIGLFRTNKKKVAERAGRIQATLVNGTLALGHDKSDDKSASKGTADKGDDKQAGNDPANKEKAKQEADAEKSAETGKGVVKAPGQIRLTEQDMHLMSHNGTVASLEAAADAIQKNYETAMREWGTSFDKLLNLGSANINPVGQLKEVNDSLRSKFSSGFKKELNLGELLVVKTGTDREYPLIGSDVKVVPSSKVEGRGFIEPTKPELEKLVQKIKSDLEATSQAEKAMEAAAQRVEKLVADYQKFDSEKDVSGGVDTKKATDHLMSASSAFSKGIALAGTHYVSGYNTMLSLVQRAIQHA